MGSCSCFFFFLVVLHLYPRVWRLGSVYYARTRARPPSALALFRKKLCNEIHSSRAAAFLALTLLLSLPAAPAAAAAAAATYNSADKRHTRGHVYIYLSFSFSQRLSLTSLPHTVYSSDTHIYTRETFRRSSSSLTLLGRPLARGARTELTLSFRSCAIPIRSLYTQAG